MQVSVRVLWHVIVEYDVHSLNVHSSTEKVGSNQNSLFKETRNERDARKRLQDRQQRFTVAGVVDMPSQGKSTNVSNPAIKCFIHGL